MTRWLIFATLVSLLVLIGFLALINPRSFAYWLGRERG